MPPLRLRVRRSVAADVACHLHRAVQIILRPRVQRSAGDRAIVAAADQDHAIVGVGERDSLRRNDQRNRVGSSVDPYRLGDTMSTRTIAIVALVIVVVVVVVLFVI